MDHESLVIVLRASGASPEPPSLADLPNATVRWQRVECEGTAACVVARVRHPDPPEAFGSRVTGWGRARGWAVTVASCKHPG